MKNTILFLDLDGTLTVLDTNIMENLLAYPNYFLEHTFANDRAIGLVSDFIREYQICEENVYILTKAPSFLPTAKDDKMQWIEKHLEPVWPGISQRAIVQIENGISKRDFIQELFDDKDCLYILIDDYTNNLHEWEKNQNCANFWLGIKAMNGYNRREGKWKGLLLDLMP